MDETNERLVWDLLLHTATNYSAQYLYLAPKFPRQLEYNEDMTVVFVHNGLNKLAQSERESKSSSREKNSSNGGKREVNSNVSSYLKAAKKARGKYS